MGLMKAYIYLGGIRVESHRYGNQVRVGAGGMDLMFLLHLDFLFHCRACACASTQTHTQLLKCVHLWRSEQSIMGKRHSSMPLLTFAPGTGDDG